MGLPKVTEKHTSKRSCPKEKSGHTAIILCQHVLAWSSSFVAGSTTYLLVTQSLDTESLVSESLVLANASTSLIYLCLHNIAAVLTARAHTEQSSRTRTRLQSFAKHCLRFSVTAWLTTCCVAITFTLARHPGCVGKSATASSPLDVGSICIVQRTSVAAGLLALIVSAVLFVLLHRSREPFHCHLFGTITRQPLLPQTLPYRNTLECTKFSEMSFKCRSSATSFSSRTLAPSHADSTTSLLPTKPEKAYGLGIHTSITPAPSFLGPRPSLSSIRTYASINRPPPSSPLPPLPVFFSDTYRSGSAMHKAIHPPQRPARPAGGSSDATVRIVPASPALSTANLMAWNRSAESLSSVYSRSITGEPRPRMGPGARTTSSSSTATVKKSPLGMMRLASQPSIVLPSKYDPSSQSSEEESDDLDDAATLQARLPHIRAISDFGEVESWSRETAYQQSYQVCIGEMAKLDFGAGLNGWRRRDIQA